VSIVQESLDDVFEARVPIKITREEKAGFDLAFGQDLADMPSSVREIPAGEDECDLFFRERAADDAAMVPSEFRDRTSFFEEIVSELGLSA
jgi:hypothetical protein